MLIQFWSHWHVCWIIQVLRWFLINWQIDLKSFFWSGRCTISYYAKPIQCLSNFACHGCSNVQYTTYVSHIEHWTLKHIKLNVVSHFCISLLFTLHITMWNILFTEHLSLNFALNFRSSTAFTFECDKKVSRNVNIEFQSFLECRMPYAVQDTKCK